MNEMKKMNSKVLLVIIVIIMIIWLICFMIRFTPLIQDYIVNLITSIIMANTINLFLILGSAIVMYRITCKIENNTDKGGKNNGEY